MRALFCEGQGRVTLIEVPNPLPGPGDALVRIEASAICGSERQAFLEGPAGVTAEGCRANTGHEACGIVVEPGSSHFQPGSRVGLSAIAGCGECDRCLAGQEIHCRREPRITGTDWHAEYAVLPGPCLRELPRGTGPAVGAMLTGDTLGVAGRAFRRDPSSRGDPIVVIGLGPVGLGHVLVRAFTGAEVIAIEPSAYRRELALGLGATTALTPGEALDIKPRLVFECTGRPECIAQALEIVDATGCVHQSGLCHADVRINPMLFFKREIAYTGDMYYASEDYQSMLDLLQSGLPLERICTHEIGPADAQSAVTDFLKGLSGKVIIRWD